MSKHVRVAVIGDQFVGIDLFTAALQRELAPVVGDVDIVSLRVPWPDTPLQYNDEVKEFLGDPAAVAALAQDADVLLTHVAPVTQAVIDAAPHLRIIGCCRGGPVNINVAAATARGIPVVNAPARNSQAVVEFTIGLILAECRGIGRAHAALSQGVWLGDLYRYDRTGRELARSDDRAGRFWRHRAVVGGLSQTLRAAHSHLRSIHICRALRRTGRRTGESG
jgi:D-3-phosphoglycerate dehydrogenase